MLGWASERVAQRLHEVIILRSIIFNLLFYLNLGVLLVGFMLLQVVPS